MQLDCLFKFVKIYNNKKHLYSALLVLYETNPPMTIESPQRRVSNAKSMPTTCIMMYRTHYVDHCTTFYLDQGSVSIWRYRLTSIGIPMLKITRSHDRLIFNMGIPIHRKDGLYIDTGAWIFHLDYTCWDREACKYMHGRVDAHVLLYSIYLWSRYVFIVVKLTLWVLMANIFISKIKGHFRWWPRTFSWANDHFNRSWMMVSWKPSEQKYWLD